jgi:MscS family membrane protein
MASIQRRFLVLLVICFWWCATASPSAGQTNNGLTAADTSSPRATLRSFIDSCNELYELIQKNNCLDRSDPLVGALSLRILDCLDTSELPAYRREHRASEVSAALKGILDRIEIPPWEEIPDTEDIEALGGFDKSTLWRIPETRIVIARATSGAEQGEYMFSPEVVRMAIRHYREINHLPHRTDEPKTSPRLYQWFVSAPGHPALGPIFERLPDWLKFQRTFGVTNWKWPGILVALAVAILLMLVLYRLYKSFSLRVMNKSAVKYFFVLVFPIAAMLVPLLFENLVERYLRVRGTPVEIIRFGSYLVALIAAVFVIFATANRFAELLISVRRSEYQGRDAMIHILAKLTAVFLTVVLLVIGGQFLGIPVTTVLASAGIGGIAVALAAQDTLKNLFATLTIVADQPCRVGDLIRIDGIQGFVEDIGMRTTKVRSEVGYVAAIPNEQLAGQKVENLSRSNHIRRDAEIQLPLDTPSDKVDRAVEIIRKHLDNHECMDPGRPAKVFLDDLAPPGFRIMITYWYCRQETGDGPTQSYQQMKWSCKAFNDRLNRAILSALDAEGISLVLVGREEDWRASTNSQ